jgi:medium-chain acyl-[acyl-carrier-protein] hydrolase
MIVRWQIAPAARLRLVCFPYAGGGAASFRGWACGLPPWVEVLAVELPGRGRRFHERPHRDCAALVREAVALLLPFLDRPFLIFGHSMGALIAFEVARALRRHRAPMPERLLVSGAAAPHTPRRGRALHRLADDDLITALRDLNGTPPQVLDSREMIDLVLPTLRADFELFDTYCCTPEPPLTCPLSVFGGTRDRFAPAGALEPWREHTTAGFALHMVPGEHFFLADQALFLPMLARELLPARPDRIAPSGWTFPATTSYRGGIG